MEFYKTTPKKQDLCFSQDAIRVQSLIVQPFTQGHKVTTEKNIFHLMGLLTDLLRDLFECLTLKQHKAISHAGSRKWS